MTVAADESVAMPHVDDVSIATLPPREDHDAVADRSDWSAHRCCVIGAFVTPPDAQHRMAPAAENAGDPAERYRCAEKCSTERLSCRVEVLSLRAGGAREQNRFDLISRQREAGSEDLVHENGAVGLLEPLDEDVELVPVLQ